MLAPERAALTPVPVGLAVVIDRGLQHRLELAEELLVYLGMGMLLVVFLEVIDIQESNG